ncbi:hypothetical protein [Psychroserpens sp.]|uniref:hypothetical protein n=1 Tax=Psychroserpens sp. TaxID=2020870 RepID=UPI001B0B1A21|nr:hypothetical protein [Psychroserpens sp.]MBO6606685.1 hypothetical protein [Psychroserpens sp.]MBO6631404.1 hypothetical protein [Psychroserpens sp.]MBO6653389.1 hypothetical protein [Psychroserpens sp.]MBO6680584.1 hypothetical protein [Psychroserpens sp.]MBO6750458.1 hypothetical protein [Psychroserpens sp.]
MKQLLTLVLVLFSQAIVSQQYDSVVIETSDIDTNNEIYKTGTNYVFDYEIIQNGKAYKLKKNNGMFAGSDFELVPVGTDSLEVEKINMSIQAVPDEDRSNENQTQITYSQIPSLNSYQMTGLVENTDNIWLHPTRAGFFNSLETCPFPFIKKPLKVGTEWTDAMKIGQGWRNELWGMWEGSLILDYTYNITGKKLLKTELGSIECFIIESTASSSIGTTKLTSYFSEEYGFVRYEYELLNDLQVNFWVIDYKSASN